MEGDGEMSDESTDGDLANELLPPFGVDPGGAAEVLDVEASGPNSCCRSSVDDVDVIPSDGA